MKHPINQPNLEQACAVLRFATANGPAWKAALHIYWLDDKPPVRLSDDERALLRQVRNQCGPTWLEQVSLPALTVTCVQRFITLGGFLARKHYGLTPDDMGLEEQQVLACILNGVGVLDLLNEQAQDFDLSRLDKSDYGVPSTAELTPTDLAAATSELKA